MNNTRHLPCIAALVLALARAASATGGGPPPPGVDPLVPDQALVRLAPSVAIGDFLASFNAAFPGTTVIGEIASRKTYKLALPVGAPMGAVEAQLLQQVAQGALVWGELNYQGQAAEGKTDSIWVSQLNIDQPQYAGQYAVALLGLAAAQQGSQGQGVLVAVLDTGIDAAHPALAGRIATGGANFVDGGGTDDVGDGLDNDGDGLVDEMVGHGTFVAGLVALVAPQAKLVPVKVLDSEGIGDTFSIAQGIYHAIDRGVQVINCSFGSTYKGEAVHDAVIEADSKGIVVVGASGNFDREEPEEFPALISGALGIGATTKGDLKASFSNYNHKLALCAPGESQAVDGAPGVFDPAKSVISALPGGGYGVWRGTSFATAFVSGAAALVRAQHPGAPPTHATAALVSSALLDSAVPIDALNPPYAGLLGDGRVNAAAAVALAPAAPQVGDLNGDGQVNGADLGLLLGNWGPCSGAPMCAGDLDLDGTVDGADLGLLLGLWMG
ncbi:MAG: S8 family serine peptidase [Phycisphaerales bacterium]